VWWHSTAKDPNSGQVQRNLINFGRINDAQIDRDLDQGRQETDPAKRKALYQDIGVQFAKQAYNIWGWYEDWAFAAKPSVSGLVGPDLPNGDARGIPIVSVEPVVGLWISK
jgi:ABC-type transport system substrate-binding protein